MARTAEEINADAEEMIKIIRDALDNLTQLITQLQALQIGHAATFEKLQIVTNDWLNRGCVLRQCLEFYKNQQQGLEARIIRIRQRAACEVAGVPAP
jgi:hypothetical protein